MPVNRDDLAGFAHELPPPPPRVEPLLSVEDEVALLSGGRAADETVPRRRARVLALIRRPATPEAADAELIVLLAAAKALPLERREDRLSARQRIAGIASRDEPPPGVAALMERLNITAGDGVQLAEALLPSGHDWTPGWQGPLYAT